QVAVENLFQDLSDDRMIAAEGEHTPTAKQVKILQTLPVIQVLALPALVRTVEADCLQHAHHLFIQIARMQRVTLRFRFDEEVADFTAHLRLQARLTRRWYLFGGGVSCGAHHFARRFPTPSHPQGFPESPLVAWFFRTS